jgi:glycosyltransferase involved in cell wall biosynthesis
MKTPEHHRIGIVSTRLSGTDGVSLETAKWEMVLNELGYDIFYFAGESDRPAECTHLVPEAHFQHPDIVRLNKDLFDDYRRSSETSGQIQSLRFHLKSHLYKFIEKFDIELLIVENAWAIPMNIPLGMALTELIAETNMPAIGHHHDFAWERSRFKVTAASDYQFGAFPPVLPSIRHVVINSYAGRQLALRTGASSTLIPNVMDFDHPPPGRDGYADDLRTDLGINENEPMLLQPTRIVPRKKIEDAIELARRLGNCTLVISHHAGDEGSEYERYLRDFSELMNVKVLFAAERFEYHRSWSEGGSKRYSLADAYQVCDLVTYPSSVEGFGNAFLETIYYKKPIVIRNYEIFKTDIQPLGFRVIDFGDFITEETVQKTREMLENRNLVAEIVDHNYELCRRYYSFAVLERRLVTLLNECLGE